MPKTKVCTKCGKRKKLEEYHVDRAHSACGRKSRCRACVAESDAHASSAYYLANRARCLAARAAYHAANRDKRAAYNAAYRAANKARIAAQQAAYNRLHREARRTQQAAYHAKNREWRNWMSQQYNILSGGIR